MINTSESLFYQYHELEELLCAFFELEHMTLEELRRYVNKLLRDMDQMINSSIYDEDHERIRFLIKILFLTQQNINIAKVIRPKSFYTLQLGMFQSTINTLIKQVDDTVSLTYRLGMRPAGMDNNNGTNVAGELHLENKP